MNLSFKSFLVGVLAGVLASFLLLVGLGFAIYFMAKNRVADFEKAEVLLLAPDFPATSKLTVHGQAQWDWTLRTLDGKEVRLGDFRGKVLFVNFWATWCQPCVREMPAIGRLQASLKEERVAFLLITDEEANTVQKFVKERKWSLPIYLNSGELPPGFNAIGVPTTFMVSPDGGIIYKRFGAAQWDDDSCRKFIRALL